MASYLHTRNGHYYLRLRTPSDLLHVIPDAELLKSLHTKDHKSARLSVSCLLPKFLEVFTLSRTGFITQEQASERLNTLLGRNKKLDTYRPHHTTSQPTDVPSPMLSEVIQEYMNDKQSGWTAKTLLEYRSYLRLIQDIIQVETIVDVNRDEVRRLRDTLCKLPANLYKKYPKKTIMQILEIDDVTPMSISTVNKLLNVFSSVMTHSIKEGYRKDNPVDGLKINQNRRTEEERKTYTREDIKKIASALPSPIDSPERYWIPWIGMYSGMRLGEICGLHLDDIKQVDGVWCFDVNEDGDKRLKNLYSKRLIPIHPELVQKGFLSFIETLRKTKEIRLWPNLVRREIDGYCHALGNWFGRLNRKYVTEDPQKTFHSLRHSFADTLKQLGVQEVMIAELMGHASGSITMSRYGKRYKPEVLLEVVQKIDYELTTS